MSTSFKVDLLQEKDWVRLHRTDLKELFEQSGRYSATEPTCGTCEVCMGSGVDPDYVGLPDMPCMMCDGDGQVILSEPMLFNEFCYDEYWTQRNKDLKKYLAWLNDQHLTREMEFATLRGINNQGD